MVKVPSDFAEEMLSVYNSLPALPCFALLDTTSQWFNDGIKVWFKEERYGYPVLT
jgi:hypothetical protein